MDISSFLRERKQLKKEKKDFTVQMANMLWK
jgi:hypothetical protein